VRLFRLRLDFLAEAHKREQKALFGRGLHFLGDRMNYKTKDIIGKITNLFCIYLFQITYLHNLWRQDNYRFCGFRC
jgi:hypothetical protein